jgi:hypothetical protein
MLIETYPEQLITKDKWGALPLLYAIWGAVPRDVIQLLLESYQQYFPDYRFEWTCMVETLAKAVVPHDRIAKLLYIKATNFQNQRLDWDDLLNRLAQSRSSHDDHLGRFGDMFRYLVMFGTLERVKAIGLTQWRNGITNLIATQSINYRRLELFLARIRNKLIHLEQEYCALKTSTTMLELALWKNKLNDEDGQEMMMTKLDKSSNFRQCCRVICGSDIIVECVLPYLIQVYA